MNLEKLYTLQEVEKNLYSVKKEKESPRGVEELLREKERIETEYVRIKIEKEALKKEKRKEKRLEDEMGLLEAKIKENEELLYEDNKLNFQDLEGLQKQIKGEKLENARLEEEIIYIMNNLDNRIKKVEKDKNILQEDLRKYKKEVRILKERMENLDKEEEVLEKTIREIREVFSKPILKEYHKVQEEFDFSGITRVSKDRCSGCGIILSIVQLKEIKKNEKLNYCEHCHRILFA